MGVSQSETAALLRNQMEEQTKRETTKYEQIHVSHDTIKRVFGSFRPGQTQTGLRSRRS